MGSISRNKFWDEVQALRDAEYMRQKRVERQKELQRIETRLDIHEQLIQELIKDVEAYIKEHYDGKEEKDLPL